MLDAIEGVTLIFWLLGSPRATHEASRRSTARGSSALLEEIVDTPVRGFVYELTRTLEPAPAAARVEALRAADERWRIPFEVVAADPASPRMWLAGMLAAAASWSADCALRPTGASGGLPVAAGPGRLVLDLLRRLVELVGEEHEARSRRRRRPRRRSP